MTRRQILRYAKRVLLSLNTVKAAYLLNSEAKIRLFRVTAKKDLIFFIRSMEKKVESTYLLFNSASSSRLIRSFSLSCICSRKCVWLTVFRRLMSV